jgi:hypothetical protein
MINYFVCIALKENNNNHRIKRKVYTCAHAYDISIYPCGGAGAYRFGYMTFPALSSDLITNPSRYQLFFSQFHKQIDIYIYIYIYIDRETMVTLTVLMLACNGSFTCRGLQRTL